MQAFLGLRPIAPRCEQLSTGASPKDCKQARASAKVRGPLCDYVGGTKVYPGYLTTYCVHPSQLGWAICGRLRVGKYTYMLICGMRLERLTVLAIKVLVGLGA
jgi:hypothetical protein